MTTIFQNKYVNAVKKAVVGIFAVALLIGIGWTPAYAQSSGQVNNPTKNAPAEYTLLEPLPCIDSETNDCTPGDQIEKVSFENYVQYAFNLFIALAAVSAVFMIVWGGFLYMTSEAPGVKSDGLKKVENAIYGLLLVLCSYLILKTIDPRLVQIPTTLVAPLDITYRPDEVATFMQQLIDDANKYRTENNKILRDLEKFREDMKVNEQKRSALCDELIQASGYGEEYLNTHGYFDKCDAIMAQARNLSPEARAIVVEIEKVKDEMKGLQTQITTKTAVGLLNAKIQGCYGINTNSTYSSSWYTFGLTGQDAGQQAGNLTTEQCMEDFSKISNKYAAELNRNGDGLAARGVRDYAVYAESISKINTTVLEEMSDSPSLVALVNTLQSSVTIAATAVTAAYGGVVGGVAGFAGAQVFNGIVIGAPVAAANAAAAKLTIAKIQLEVNNNINKIYDEKIKEQYKTQAYMLIKKLGGKGDGTDSVQPALDKKSLENTIDNTQSGLYFPS